MLVTKDEPFFEGDGQTKFFILLFDGDVGIEFGIV
jgi:hypothetical protein